MGRKNETMVVTSYYSIHHRVLPSLILQSSIKMFMKVTNTDYVKKLIFYQTWM